MLGETTEGLCDRESKALKESGLIVDVDCSKRATEPCVACGRHQKSEGLLKNKKKQKS